MFVVDYTPGGAPFGCFEEEPDVPPRYDGATEIGD
jgi:hypothetical protein